MDRKFRFSCTHCYFVLRPIQVSSLAGYWNSSYTEFCVNNTKTSKGRVWFLIAFSSMYFISREICLQKVYFRCRIKKSYRKVLLKLKVDEKLKENFILNIKIWGKGLSKRHILVFHRCFTYYLIFSSYENKNIVFATGDIFCYIPLFTDFDVACLRPSSDEYGDSNPAGLPFFCHISSDFNYPQISLSFQFLKCHLSSTTHQLFLLTHAATRPEKDKLF
jgi:hypothetical protein